MRRKKVAVGAAALAVAFLVGFGGTAASAATSNGTQMNSTIGGIPYKSYNQIFTSGSVATAYSFICPTSGVSSAGWMGSKPRLFKGTSLLVQADVGYTSSSYGANACFTRGAPASGSGSYYSHGWTVAWNGSGYVTLNITRSPSLTI